MLTSLRGARCYVLTHRTHPRALRTPLSLKSRFDDIPTRRRYRWKARSYVPSIMLSAHIRCTCSLPAASSNSGSRQRHACSKMAALPKPSRRDLLSGLTLLGAWYDDPPPPPPPPPYRRLPPIGRPCLLEGLGLTHEQSNEMLKLKGCNFKRFDSAALAPRG